MCTNIKLKAEERSLSIVLAEITTAPSSRDGGEGKSVSVDTLAVSTKKSPSA